MMMHQIELLSDFVEKHPHLVWRVLWVFVALFMMYFGYNIARFYVMLDHVQARQQYECERSGNVWLSREARCVAAPRNGTTIKWRVLT